MTLRSKQAWLATVVMVMTIAACSIFQPAKSFDEKLAYAYGVHTAVLDAAATGVELGTLSIEDAQQVLRLSDESRTLLDTARLASGGSDLKTAEGQLALATNILTQLQAYLRAKEVR